MAGRKSVSTSVLERALRCLDERDVPAFGSPPVVRTVNAIGLAVLPISLTLVVGDVFPTLIAPETLNPVAHGNDVVLNEVVRVSKALSLDAMG